MADRIIACPCEDVTLAEVRRAVARGHRTLEEIKRVTGLATGACQGRQCVVPCLLVVAADAGCEPDRVGLITLRPPARPVALGELAGGGPP